MAVPFKYNLRHLKRRWRSVTVAVLCMALVVAVFIIVMSLAQGLRITYVNTGDPRNLLVLRKGALAESSSQITPNEVNRVRYLSGITLDSQGQPIVSAEVLILITLERIGAGQAHVQVRGLGPMGLRLRPYAHIVEGRMFQTGMRECIVSRKISRRFENCGLGESFRSGKHEWQVVGIFEAPDSAYNSEIWMNADEAREAYNRDFYSSLVLRPESEAAAKSLIDRIVGDRQMRLGAMRETEYFEELTTTVAPIRFLGFFLAGLMSVGAIFMAMNTMYAIIGARIREVGTLRILGFSRRSIYCAFLLESLMMSFISGILGCLAALPLHGVATGTFNWASFSEVAFEFRITIEWMAAGFLFSLMIGTLSGLLPAASAVRKPVLNALRSV